MNKENILLVIVFGITWFILIYLAYKIRDNTYRIDRIKK